MGLAQARPNQNKLKINKCITSDSLRIILLYLIRGFSTFFVIYLHACHTSLCIGSVQLIVFFHYVKKYIIN